MQVKIEETGKIEQLNCYWGDVPEECTDFKLNDTDTYLCNQEAYDWWVDYLEEKKEADQRKEDMNLTNEEKEYFDTNFPSCEFNDIYIYTQSTLDDIQAQRYKKELTGIAYEDTLDAVVDQITAIHELYLPHKQNTYKVIIFDDDPGNFWLTIDESLFQGNGQYGDFLDQIDNDEGILVELNKIIKR